MKNQYIITAKFGENGLNIFLIVHGMEHYICTRRRNGLFYSRIANGISLGELYRIKPNHTRSGQKYYHYVQYLIKIVEDYIKYDLVA